MDDCQISEDQEQISQFLLCFTICVFLKQFLQCHMIVKQCEIVGIELDIEIQVICKTDHQFLFKVILVLLWNVQNQRSRECDALQNERIGWITLDQCEYRRQQSEVLIWCEWHVLQVCEQHISESLG